MLAACTEPDRWSAIEAQADLLVAAAERGVADHADLATVYAEAAALRRDLAARQAGGPLSPATSGRHPSTPPPPT